MSAQRPRWVLYLCSVSLLATALAATATVVRLVTCYPKVDLGENAHYALSPRQLAIGLLFGSLPYLGLAAAGLMSLRSKSAAIWNCVGTIVIVATGAAFFAAAKADALRNGPIVVIWQAIEVLPLLAIVIPLAWQWSARAINRFSIGLVVLMVGILIVGTLLAFVEHRNVSTFRANELSRILIGVLLVYSPYLPIAVSILISRRSRSAAAITAGTSVLVTVLLVASVLFGIHNGGGGGWGGLIFFFFAALQWMLCVLALVVVAILAYLENRNRRTPVAASIIFAADGRTVS